MITTLQKNCELFIQNRNDIKKNFGREGGYMYPLCASIYTAKNKLADIERMQECKRLLKQETGILSNFRGISQ